jgi:hypothetical protein
LQETWTIVDHRHLVLPGLLHSGTRSFSPAPSFIRSPTGIIFPILSTCSSKDLASVCTTCRARHNVGTSLLYHTIDLKSHNADYDCESLCSSGFRISISNFVSRKRTYHDFSIYQRQEAFLRTFGHGCSYRKHVSELRWTGLNFDWIEEDDWELKRPGHDRSLRAWISSAAQRSVNSSCEFFLHERK